MIWFVIGVIMGATFAVLVGRKVIDISGSLVIEETEDGPYIFLELEKPVREVLDRHTVTLQVRKNKYSTHK